MHNIAEANLEISAEIEFIIPWGKYFLLQQAKKVFPFERHHAARRV